MKDHIVSTNLGYVKGWKRGGWNGNWFFTDNPDLAKRYEAEAAKHVAENVVWRGPVRIGDGGPKAIFAGPKPTKKQICMRSWRKPNNNPTLLEQEYAEEVAAGQHDGY
jgi:hypothetical protein